MILLSQTSTVHLHIQAWITMDYHTLIHYPSHTLHCLIIVSDAHRNVLNPPTLAGITHTFYPLSFPYHNQHHSLIMPNEYFSDSESGESQCRGSQTGASALLYALSPGNNGQTSNKAFEITQDDAGVLRDRLQEFQKADTERRSGIIQEVMARLYLLRPPNTPFDKMDASKVCGIHSSIFINIHL